MERVKVRFGDELAGWHYPGTNGACVVMAAGTAVAKEPGTDKFARRFSAAGFGVLAFDHRGLGESGGEPRQVVRLDDQLADWRTAIEYAGSLPGVDAVAAWGFSLSGGYVLQLATEDLGLAAVIAQTPGVDGRATVRQAMRYQRPIAMVRLLGRAMRDAIGGSLGRPPLLVPLSGKPGTVAMLTTPDSQLGHEALDGDAHPEWIQAVAARVALSVGSYRPARRARQVRCPLLVLASEQDQSAPLEPALRVAREAPGAELVRLPGGHYSPFLETHEQAIQAELDFLRRHVVRAPAGEVQRGDAARAASYEAVDGEGPRVVPADEGQRDGDAARAASCEAARSEAPRVSGGVVERGGDAVRAKASEVEGGEILRAASAGEAEGGGDAVRAAGYEAERSEAPRVSVGGGRTRRGLRAGGGVRGWSVKQVELSAGTIEYDDSGGGGPVVVLLHGFLMDSSLWAQVVTALRGDPRRGGGGSESVRCVAPTLPLGAHRLAMNADADLSLPGVARLVAEFIERLGLDDVVLVGSDTGGALVQLLLVDHPQRIARAVLVSCDAFDNFPPGLTGKVLVASGKLPRALFWGFVQQLRVRPVRRLPIAFGWLTKRGDAATARWVRPVLEQGAIRRDAVRMLRAVGADKKLLLRTAERLHGFDRPVLVVWAAEDRVMPPEHGPRLAGLFPRGTAVAVEDSYTLVPLDQPEQLAQLVEAFATSETNEV